MVSGSTAEVPGTGWGPERPRVASWGAGPSGENRSGRSPPLSTLCEGLSRPRGEGLITLCSWRQARRSTSESLSPEACRAMAGSEEPGINSGWSARVSPAPPERSQAAGDCPESDGLAATDGTRAGALWISGWRVSHAAWFDQCSLVHTVQIWQGRAREQSRCRGHLLCVSHSDKPRQQTVHLISSYRRSAKKQKKETLVRHVIHASYRRGHNT